MQAISAARKNGGIHLDVVLSEEEAMARMEWLQKEVKGLEQHIYNEQVRLDNLKRELEALQALFTG